MYEEVFEEFHLTVVELPIEFVDDLPVYRGHLKELTFLSAEASSRKKLYQQLLQAIWGCGEILKNTILATTIKEPI